jgi:hypothetical protein
MDEFQDRLLLGLDFCSVKNDMQHVAWLTSVHENGHISTTVYEKIMGGNAERLLALGTDGQ